MFRNILLLLVLSFHAVAFAGDGEYAVGNIPEALLKNANVVKRMEEVRFEMINTGETILYHKYALTILNENGDAHAAFYEWYDRLRKIQSIEGNLYDAYGRQLKKVKNKDIQDLSGTDDNNLMDDNRIKRHDFYYRVYPYTVEYEVEVKYNNSFMFPRWVPQDFEHLSVQSSRFVVTVPESYEFRYRNVNYKEAPFSVCLWKGNSTFHECHPAACPGMLFAPLSPYCHHCLQHLLPGVSADFPLIHILG
jgi:hypothetical protein